MRLIAGLPLSRKNRESGKSWVICVTLENRPNINSNSVVASLPTLLILLFC